MRLHLCGRVETGEGMATRLGCPTANIAIEQGVIIPALGVYVGEARIDGTWYDSLICISDGRTGYNLKMEVHLLGKTMELVGKQIEVVLLHKVRDIIPYPGEEQMAAVIADDLKQATAWSEQRHQKQRD